MKSDLQAKFIRHLLNNKKKDGGFTLIELLVVIIIIGILSAIALPSFLNQANKARQSEASTYVGSINRAQQVEFLEENSFADDIANLDIGISDSENYAYTTGGTLTGTDATVTTDATPQEDTLRGYAGRVFVELTGEGNATTAAILCEGPVGAPPAVGGVTTNADCP